MIEVMLAETFHLRWLPKNTIIQPKLDGIRAIWDGYKLYSRNGKELVGNPHITEVLVKNFSGVPLDGELYSHRKDVDFNSIVGNTKRTKNIEVDERIHFHIFDYPVASLTFGQRLEKLKELIKDIPYFSLVESVELDKEIIEQISNIGEDLYETDVEAKQCVENLLNVFEKQGYEGSILRNADSVYEFGKRSKNVLKVKRWYDAEFLVIDIIPLKQHKKIISKTRLPGYKKYADGTWYKDDVGVECDMVGSIVCETLDKNGNITTFEVASGFKHAQRTHYFFHPQELLSKQVTIKYQELTPRGVPRFPIFKSVRDYE